MRGEKVSLFTREWIEIPVQSVPELIIGSPSSRGSGLKFELDYNNRTSRIVSLFTREWIEIYDDIFGYQGRYVSLFTREWIEI